ncbi:MAG: nucleoside-diphosphate-sugar epimerase, partial [Saprospiraceae bacterium]
GASLVPYLNAKYSVKTISLRGYTEGEISLSNVNSVIHLAGVAHKMTEINPNEYFKINRDLTLRFAHEAKTAGVQHFVYISSTKVYGEGSSYYNESSECLPNDPYGQSKLDAEYELKKIETETFKVAIIRPPLVYGAGVKGNLFNLVSLVNRFRIIPLGGIHNQRSMVYIGNLVALIEHVVLNQNSGIVLAGDKQLHSTSYLVESISKGLSSTNKIISLPIIVRKIISKLKPSLGKRLFDSLVFDNTETNQKINFTPPYSFEQGIQEMTSHYISSRSQ